MRKAADPMTQFHEFRKRRIPNCGQMTINRRLHLFVARLSGGEREKYQAICPASRSGAFRMVHLLKRTSGTTQLLGVMRRAEIGKFNFPEILEWDDMNERIALVTSWIAGESLADRLRRAQKRPELWPCPMIAFRLFRGLAHALHYLNNRLNLVHGDINPGNLLLIRDPNRLIITDFGSAWTVEGTARRLGGDGRTDGYASPEQYQGLRQVDFRSDLFSASAVLHVMLTGELPYGQLGGKAGLPEFRKQFSKRWSAPSTKCRQHADVPRDLWKRIDAVLRRGLELDAGNRFANTNEWIDELNDIDARFRIRPSPGLMTRAVLKLIGYWNG
jgi:serine/threonine protein kinase